MTNKSSVSNARGSAGGAGSTGGAVYAGSIAGWCAVKLLMGRGASLPWSLSDRHTIKSMTCESPTHVDDLVLRLLPGGTVYVQIKHGLALDSEFNKAMTQLVRQFWTVEFSCKDDRLVIATDSSASGTVRVAVRSVLKACQDLSSGAPLLSSVTSDTTQIAFARLRECFEVESALLGKTPQEISTRFRDFLRCTHLTVYETLDGWQGNQAIESLRQIVSPAQAQHAWTLLNVTCLNAAILRTSLDRPGVWNILRRHGIEVFQRMSLAGVQVQLEDVLRGMTEQRLDQLTALEQFVPEHYVARAELDRHLKEFCASSRSLMLISGGSGQGKTSWCAQQGKSVSDRPVLLIAAENLKSSDASLSATLIRLIDRYIQEHGGHPLPAVEWSQWLKHTRLLIIVDGLDRAPSFNKQLGQWMDATLAQLTQSKMQLVVTGRPETMGRLKSSVELSALVYQPQKGAWQVPLSDFTESEARTAASNFGDPALAVYRRPSMMSYCALLHERGDVALEETEIIDRFIERRISDVINEYDILDEHLKLFIGRLSRALAGSEQGVLASDEVLDMPGFDRAAYDALRRVNFIVEAQGVLRIEPDKISERLHGRCLDVPRTIAELAQLKAFPLKVGALRFALFDLARCDAQQAIEQLQRLVEYSTNEQMDVARSLACSVFDALPDWSSLEPLAAALGESYHGNSVLLFLDSGDALLDLMVSRRWAAQQRIRLLWTLAATEPGYTWRQKHWEKMFRVTEHYVTPWRKRMLSALQDPHADGWAFLAERFDSLEAFEDYDDQREATQGHLAQGLFFLGAETRMWPALQALAKSSSKSALVMLRLLARDYSDQVAALMGDVLASNLFSLKHKRALAGGLQDTAPTPSIIAGIYQLLADCEDPELRTVCLRILGSGDDVAAVLELLEGTDLSDVDVGVCSRYSGTQFQNFAQRVFERVLQREVDAHVLNGFHYGSRSAGESYAHFEILQPLFVKVLEQSPTTAIAVSPTLEYFINVAKSHPCEWPGLFELAERVLSAADARARRFIVHAGIGEDHREPSSAGECLRARIIQSLIEHEADEGNLELLMVRLLSDHNENPQVVGWLAQLVAKYPAMPSERTMLLAQGRGMDLLELEQILNRARSFTATP